jgi:sec-independent protein translocase protein TatB
VFGIGWTEFVVIAFVLLVFVGPKHLPGMLRKAGMVISELKNASQELRQQVSDEVRDLEKAVGGPIRSPRSYVEDLGRDFHDAVDSPYAELRDAEASVKEEISTIKDNLKPSKGHTPLAGTAPPPESTDTQETDSPEKTATSNASAPETGTKDGEASS